jgi:transcriptional regulator with XRE-family HTH domain
MRAIMDATAIANQQRAGLMLLRAIAMANISQAELASRIKVSTCTMSAWINGHRNMTVANLFRCIDACGLEIIELQVRRKRQLVEAA